VHPGGRHPHRRRSGRARSPPRRDAGATRWPGFRPGGRAGAPRRRCAPSPPAPCHNGRRGAKPSHRRPARVGSAPPERCRRRSARPEAACPGWCRWPAVRRAARRPRRRVPSRGSYAGCPTARCDVPRRRPRRTGVRRRSCGNKPGQGSGTAELEHATRLGGPARAGRQDAAHTGYGHCWTVCRSQGRPLWATVARR